MNDNVKVILGAAILAAYAYVFVAMFVWPTPNYCADKTSLMFSYCAPDR